MRSVALGQEPKLEKGARTAMPYAMGSGRLPGVHEETRAPQYDWHNQRPPRGGLSEI